MSANISHDEMTMLEYLYKHSSGSGVRIWLDPKPLTRDLRISNDQFAQRSASLVTLGYAGVRDFRADANDVPSLKCSAIWVTRKGEDYLRRSKAEAGAAKVVSR
jgi:hypothetical protein